MAIALVPNQTANVSQATSTTATVTLPQAPVAGNLVVVIGAAGGENSATTATAKDGNSNVLTATPSTPHWDVGGLVVYFCFFMVAPPNASKSVTVTLGSSSSSIRVYIGEFSGASGFCEQDKYANSLANGTVINYPPIQTRANGDLIVALGSSPSSISTPATSFPYTQLSTVLSFNLAVEFYVQPMAGAIAPYFNQGSGGFSAMIAAFTPSQPFPFSQGIPKSLAMLFGAPAVTSFSMTAATGNYTLAGENLALLKKSIDNIQSGSYALTDEQLTLKKASKLNVQETPYTLTGEQITALKKSLDKLQTGTYTTSSQPALKKTSVLNVRETSYSLNVGAGIDDARSFNGTSDTISLPNVSTLDVTTQLSLSAWIYITGNPAFGSQQTVIANGNLSGRNFILDYRNVSGTTVIELSNTVGGPFGELRAATGTISNNAWHQLIFTVDWTQNPWTANCWLDGISQSVSNVGVVTSGTPDASDTKRSIGSVNSAAFWNGNLADIAVWNGHLLTAGEVSNLAAGRRANTVASGSLVGYWPILGQSPEPDKSGNGDDGTLTGTAVVAGPPALDPFGVTILGYETLLWDHLTKGQTGFYSLTGENEKLLKTSKDSAQTGFYNLTGENETLKRAASAFPQSGFYNVTGEQITLKRAASAFPQAGFYTLTGEQITLKVAHLNLIQTGFYSLTGEALSLAIPGNFTMSLGGGTYSLTDETLTLIKKSVLGIQVATYALTDEAQKLLKGSLDKTQTGFYNLNQSGPSSLTESGLQLHYTFNDGTATDSSGNGFDGTEVNSPTSVSGQISNALQFNGTSQYVTIPSDPSGPFSYSATWKGSIALWFRTTGTNGGILAQTVTGQTPGSTTPSGYVPVVYIGSDGKLYCSLFWHNSASFTISSSGTFNDGNWHFFVDTYDGSTETAYVDGNSIGSQTLGQTDYGSGAYQYFLGVVYSGGVWANLANPQWSYFNGSIDDFQVYNRALSSSEVTAIYNAGTSGTVTGNETLLWKHLDKAQAGFYVEGGQNETLKATRLLNAQMTPFSLTGESLTLTIPGNFSMSIGSGAYTLTDNNLTLTKTSKLFASAVTYALTGEQLALLKASKDFPQTGFYTATDENVTLKATHRLNAAEGSYALTDEALALNAAHLAKAQSGSYSLTGNNERLLKSSLLSVQEGSYALTVEQVRELWKHFNQIQTGYYNLTGESLTLSQIIGAFSMLLQTGNYSLTGENVTIQITTQVVVNIAALISLLGSEVGGTLLGSEIGGALLGNEIVSALLGNEVGGTLLGNEIVTSVLGAAVLAPIPTLHFVMHPQTGTYSVDG